MTILQTGTGELTEALAAPHGSRLPEHPHARVHTLRPNDLRRPAGLKWTPYIRQPRTNECGLACLAMVAAYHGINADLPTLRRACDLSPEGATLKALMQLAEQLGLKTRPLKAEVEHLGEIALPAILHWNMNHFVVLTDVRQDRLRGRRFDIHDPAARPRTIRRTELSRCFTGVALEVTKRENSQPLGAQPHRPDEVRSLPFTSGAPARSAPRSSTRA